MMTLHEVIVAELQRQANEQRGLGQGLLFFANGVRAEGMSTIDGQLDLAALEQAIHIWVLNPKRVS